MYAPLDYMEQIKNMAFAVDNVLTADVINKTNLDFTEEMFSEEYIPDIFVRDFCTYFSKLMARPNFKEFPELEVYSEIRKHYNHRFDSLVKDSNARYYSPDSDYDFFTQLFQQFIYYDWRFHKLSYRLSGQLGRQLDDMDFPKNAYCKFFTNLPARTFYIDLAEVNTSICEDMAGMFVTNTIADNTLYLCITCLLHGKHGRIMPLFASNRLNLGGIDLEHIDEDDKLIAFDSIRTGKDKLVFEDGVERTFEMSALLKFIANFLVYMQASNKDVEENSAVKGNFSKPVDRTKEVKNKFREMRQYDVGYKLSTPMPNKNKTNDSKGGTGSPKSAHYRSAHWHHFWTGSGTDKKLIIKWIEGVFVNGKAEQNVAVVHKVK